RDHILQFAQARISTQAHTRARKSHPDSSATTFYFSCERTVINYFVRDRGETTYPFQRRSPQENTAARCPRRPRLRTCSPAWRIKHQEKIEKWRNDQLFRERLRLQQNHHGSQIEVVQLGSGN